MTSFMKDIANNYILNCRDLNEMRSKLRISSYDEVGKVTVKAVSGHKMRPLYSIQEDDYNSMSNNWIAACNLRRTGETRNFWLLNHMLDQGINLTGLSS